MLSGRINLYVLPPDMGRTSFLKFETLGLTTSKKMQNKFFVVIELFNI